MKTSERDRARRIVEGGRACIIAPAKIIGLWAVSLDGDGCDSLHESEAEAERSAREWLRDPECPMWIEVRP